MSQENDGPKKADFGKREAPERAKQKEQPQSLLERLGRLVGRRPSGKMQPKAGATRSNLRQK